MLYLSLADTERLDIRMAEVVPAIEEAFRLVGQGKAVVAPRTRLLYPPLPAGSRGEGRQWERDLRIIPGAIEGIGFGVRLGGSAFRQSVAPCLALFDWETVGLQALISDHIVHAIRSTAPDGVLAKYLALPDAGTVGLIGSGRLARWAAEAVCAVRPIRLLKVWSPTPAHRQECADYLQRRAGEGLRVETAASAEETVRGAQVVVTATTAAEPVLRGEWLDAGSTVIVNRPEELDEETVRRGRVVSTYNEGVATHVPPFAALRALPPGVEITELPDVVLGRALGRTSPREIMVGLNPAYGILDAATAEFVYRKAVGAGIGVQLEA